MSDTKLTLRQKLVQVYEKIDHIEKKGDNKKQGYKFVRSADVLRAVRTAFAELGIYAETDFQLLGTYDIKTNAGGVMHTATVRATISLHDVDSIDILHVSGLGDGADSGDKGIYKAQTGAVKNALRNAFLVPDEADPEADESVDEATQEEPRRIPTAYHTPAPPPVPHVGETVRYNVTPPPKAEIPQTGQQAMPNPELPAATGGALPDEKQLEEFRGRIRTLADELGAAGLKASRGVPLARKIVKYFQRTTSVEELNTLTLSQWQSLWQFVDKTKSLENGLAQLVKLVEGGKA